MYIQPLRMVWFGLVCRNSFNDYEHFDNNQSEKFFKMKHSIDPTKRKNSGKNVL